MEASTKKAYTVFGLVGGFGLAYALPVALSGNAKDPIDARTAVSTPSSIERSLVQNSGSSFYRFGSSVYNGENFRCLNDIRGLAPGDFDGDGDIDLAIIGHSARGDKVELYLFKNRIDEKEED